MTATLAARLKLKLRRRLTPAAKLRLRLASLRKRRVRLPVWRIEAERRQSAMLVQRTTVSNDQGCETDVSLNVILRAPTFDRREEKRCERFAFHASFDRVEFFYLTPLEVRRRGELTTAPLLPTPEFLATQVIRLLSLTLGPIVLAYGPLSSRAAGLKRNATVLHDALCAAPLCKQRLHHIVYAAGPERCPADVLAPRVPNREISTLRWSLSHLSVVVI